MDLTHPTPSSHSRSASSDERLARSASPDEKRALSILGAANNLRPLRMSPVGKVAPWTKLDLNFVR